jgi:mono/diheme cytochrome c family protein
MPSRYTTKIRAKRIELHYFKHLYPFRRWKLILTIAVPAIAAAWLLVMAARGDQRVYTSGPVSTGHAMFGVQCAQCHVPASAAAGLVPARGSGFWLRVSDQSCLKCHDGAVHHETQVGNTPCVSCHVEHKGEVVLAAMKDAHCTRCHADLRTKDGTSSYERKIDDFTGRHPEFAVQVTEGDRAVRVRLDDKARLKDTAQVKLNHQKHLKVGLRGLDDLAKQGAKGLVEAQKGLQLSCTFCHRPDAQQAYMAPVTYKDHCAVCHPLGFDAEKFPDAVAPHDKPEIVHAYLRTKYLEAPEGEKSAKLDKGEKAETKEEDEAQPRRRLGRRDEPAEEEPRARGRLGGRRDEPEEKAAPKGFKETESFLFQNRQGQGCKLCHTVTAGEKLPAVAPTCIPARWLRHSRFDHAAHRPLACTECHKALQSTETTDVLMPSIGTCRECHHSAGARAGCVECHPYHDKAKTRDLNGPLTIRELLTGAPAPRGPAPVKATSVSGPC